MCLVLEHPTRQQLNTPAEICLQAARPPLLLPGTSPPRAGGWLVPLGLIPASPLNPRPMRILSFFISFFLSCRRPQQRVLGPARRQRAPPGHACLRLWAVPQLCGQLCGQHGERRLGSAVWWVLSAQVGTLLLVVNAAHVRRPCPLLCHFLTPVVRKELLHPACPHPLAAVRQVWPAGGAPGQQAVQPVRGAAPQVWAQRVWLAHGVPPHWQRC